MAYQRYRSEGRCLPDLGRREQRAHKDETVDAVFQERLQRSFFAPQLPAPGAEQDAITPVPCNSLNAIGDLGKKRVVQVIEQHPDCVAVAAGQRPGHGVGTVPQRGGSGQDARPPLLADLRFLAHYQGD